MLRASRGARPQELLGTNIAANLQLVVQVAKEYTEQLGAGKIIEMLEAHKSYHGLYYYLGGYIAFSEDPEARPHSPAAYGPGPCWRAGVGLRRRIGGGGAAARPAPDLSHTINATLQRSNARARPAGGRARASERCKVALTV